MQRYTYFSDLHGHGLDFKNPEDADTIALVAGDLVTSFGNSGFQLSYMLGELGERFKEVIFVPGNHEYYNTSIDRWREKVDKLIAAMGYRNVTILNNESVVRDDVLIIGSTLWSDVSKHQFDVKHGMNDYRFIRMGPASDPYKSKLTTGRVMEEHFESLHYISSELQAWEGDCIVVSHHAPSERSISERYAGESLNCAFVTEISLAKWPNYWIHGHTHSYFNYIHNGCNILCNPGGYYGEFTGFDPRNNHFYL